MLKDDEVSISPFPSRHRHNAISHRLYPCTGGRHVVDALMSPPFLQDGMKAAGGKAGTDAGEFQRRAQKYPAQVLAVRRVITAFSTVAPREIHSPVRHS